MRQYRDVGEHDEWNGVRPAFVWQHHDLFHLSGLPLARRHGCPLVSYVHAPQVWEAARWESSDRDGLVERFGERPQLLQSDVVAVASEEVRLKLYGSESTSCACS